jgi:hypothetical protein
MTEESFDNNLEAEKPEEQAPSEITPPPLPTTGYETQVLSSEEEIPAEEEPPVVITTPPVLPEPAKELEMPSPFEQEQPEPITVGSPIEPESSQVTPVYSPTPTPPSGGAPKKNNTTLIIIIVIVAVILLCCCCVLIVFGASFWDDIAWELGLNLVQRLM